MYKSSGILFFIHYSFCNISFPYFPRNLHLISIKDGIKTNENSSFPKNHQDFVSLEIWVTSDLSTFKKQLIMWEQESFSGFATELWPGRESGTPGMVPRSGELSDICWRTSNKDGTREQSWIRTAGKPEYRRDSIVDSEKSPKCSLTRVSRIMIYDTL